MCLIGFVEGLRLPIRCALANGKIIPAAIKSDIRDIGMTKIFIVNIETFARALPSSPMLCVDVLLIDSLAIIYCIPHSSERGFHNYVLLPRRLAFIMF